MHANDILTIGELAARTGVAVSALRFYEAKRLIAPMRNGGGQRRYFRSDVRRVSFILIAQQLGLTIDDIRIELDKLPQSRTPTAADWGRISADLRGRLDARIAAMTHMRELLDGCIGCGCLSLKKCGLYNARDKAASRGSGPRYLMGDRAADITEVDARGV
jgi:MerR family transcriptional regulator, redox-sensitive transcriptional activator SoxR